MEQEYVVNVYAPEIEQFPNQICRDFMGLNGFANTYMALGDCGRLPMCVMYHTKCIKVWCKRMEQYRYPRNWYIMLNPLDDIGRVNWVSRVKGLLFRYGVGYVWLAQDVGDINLFIHQLKLRLSYCMRQS